MPTPTNDYDFDFAAARAYFQEKEAAQKAKRYKLWQQAHADAQAIIALIIERYQPDFILQWGSVLHPDDFWEASDIDLAIAGVDSVVFLQLLGDVEDLTKFPLHLLRWEEVRSHYQDGLRRRGKIVYEKE